MAVRAQDAQRGWALVEVEKQPVNKAPPHSHPWAEVYYFLSGGMGMLVGDRQISCTPGVTVTVAPGVVHAFIGEVLPGTRFLALMTPGDGLDFFRDVDREIPPGPPDQAKLAAIAARHGIKIFPQASAGGASA